MMKMEHSTRVALLLNSHSQHRKVLQLVEDIANETLLLSADCVNEELGEAVVDCDLILMETHHHLTPRQQQAVKWIRLGSLAPIVVLVSEKQNPDATVDIIRAGADAVIPLSLTSDAILAHCQALMRRWRAHPYATPRFA